METMSIKSLASDLCVQKKFINNVLLFKGSFQSGGGHKLEIINRSITKMILKSDCVISRRNRKLKSWKV